MMALNIPTSMQDDIVVGLTRDEYIQALVDAAVKKGVVPVEQRLYPAMCEYVSGDKQHPHHLVIMPPGQQLGRGVTKCREESEECSSQSSPPSTADQPQPNTA